MAHTPAYRSWHAMMNRCYRPDHDAFQSYGGRGIQVCERWHQFQNFVADMGHPCEGQQIDRIDSDGDYEPQNCRWASAKENMRNRRNTPFLVINGRRQSLAEWADELGIKYQTLVSRLRRGWSVQKATGTKG